MYKLFKNANGKIIIYEFNHITNLYDKPIVNFNQSYSINKIEQNKTIVGFNLVDASGLNFYISLDSLKFYEIYPSSETSFNGSITDLFDLLLNLNNTLGGGSLDLTSLISLTELSNWDKIVGRSKEFTYIPSSLTENSYLIDTITYKKGASVEFTQTFSYDANENLISIVCS